MVNGYILFEVGRDRLLLDSGSPASLGEVSSIALAGMNFPIAESFMGQTTDSIGRLVGARISALVGFDVLRDLDLLVDLEKGTVSFSGAPLELAGDPVALQVNAGLPTIRAKVGGNSVDLVLDTGARTSYLETSLVEGLPVVGEAEDFFPSFGPFRTETRTVVVEVAGRSFTVAAGRLPGPLEMALSLLGTQGILSSALFEDAPVLISPSRGRVVLGPSFEEP